MTLGVLLLAGLVLPSAQSLQDPVPNGSALRVPTIDAPVLIDGRLDEEVWQNALVIDDFREVDPNNGDLADPGTEVRLMRNHDSFYLAVTCFEPDPDNMVLQNMHRDAFLNDDDRIEFIFDTFHDRRTAYFFQLSAAGSRGDALLSDNGRRFNKQWNTFWTAKVVIYEDRWISEVAIPFQAIAAGNDGVWGFNLNRFRGSDRSRYRWRGIEREYRVQTVNIAGTISGMDDVDQGLGLEVRPYMKAKREQTNSPSTGNFLFATGGEVTWRITPELTGSLTVNTDFAETEVDNRRVNLTRFPLFFPEKRDFFLQDSSLFEFGEQTGFGSSDSNLRPFFSRSIGLGAGGVEVPIEAGGRLAGRVGPLDIGMLGVYTGDVINSGIPSSDLYVVRPSLNVADGIAVGGLITQGNPASKMDNLVTGADVRINRNDWLPGNFSLNTYLLRSSDESISDQGFAYGMQARLRTTNWTFQFDHLSTQSSFAPALGFVRRPGERRWDAEIRWEPRPEDDQHVRFWFFEVEPTLWTDVSGDTQTFRIGTTFFGVQLHNGDQFDLRHFWQGDLLTTAFSPVTGSVIPAGRYDWQSIRARFQSSDARSIQTQISVEGGSWYNGSIGRLNVSANWRPGPGFRLGASYQENRADLPGGDFATRVASSNINVYFSEDLSLETLIQADNVSDVLGMQSRLRFIQEDGREAFVVLNLNWMEMLNGSFVPISQDLTLKVVFALRF